MTFYLKYRPQTLKDLDIESVRVTLTKMVESGRIPHALLFAGTKGTGKTSAARILAKIINCEGKSSTKPCNKCEQCKSITGGSNIDVIEMDAASNRGIDDIRILRDAVKLAPARASAKVYIIDEAHMLTTEASNALLKTLEEPPAHVYFILATTNPEKLIETIRSRTTLVSFKKANKEEIIKALSKIVKEEKLKVDKKDLELIFEKSRGSFRDAVKLLENLNTSGKLDDSSDFNVEDVLALIDRGDKKELLKRSGEINLESLLSKLNQDLLGLEGIGERMTSIPKSELLHLIELLIKASEQVKFSPIEELPLELALIKFFEKGQEIKKNEQSELQSEGQDLKKKFKNKENEQENEDVVQKDKEEVKVQETDTVVSSVMDEGIPTTPMNDVDWDKILKAVRPVNASIEALLRASKPLGFDGSNLLLGVYYKFHKERLDEIRNKKILEDVVTGIFKNPVHVNCTLTDLPKNEVKKVDLVEPQAASQEVDIAKVAEEIFS